MRANALGSMRGRRMWLLVALIGLVGLAVTAVVIGSRVRSADDAAAEAEPPAASLVTAVVERRVLSATVVGRGDVRPTQSVKIGFPSSVQGVPVVTRLSLRPGDRVREGTTVAGVSGRPVIVVQGKVPAYRDMRPGMTGTDVAALQRSLSRLECDPSGDGRGVFGPATKLCVAKLYLDAGYEPVPSSETEAADLAAGELAVEEAEASVLDAEDLLSQSQAGPAESVVLAAQAAVDESVRRLDRAKADAERSFDQAEDDLAAIQEESDRVETNPTSSQSDVEAAQLATEVAEDAVDTQRKSGEADVESAEDGLEIAEASYDELVAPPDVTSEYRALGRALDQQDTAREALDALRAVSGPIVPLGEVVFVPRLPARVESVTARIGPQSDTAESGGEGDPDSEPDASGMMMLSSGGLRVQSSVAAADVRSVREGMTVELLNESTSDVVEGLVVSVAADASSDPTGLPVHTVVVEGVDSLPAAWSGLNVRVTFTAAATDDEVLVVPLAAVSAGADGRTRVQVLSERSEDPVTVPVEAGLSADGFVEVAPVDETALSEGDRVVVGQ
ncbi:MAG: hypothetical protein M3548_02010 [Actinomycetota bacterium]|nr:hypothetical protein [Actinomycetota bacterium]